MCTQMISVYNILLKSKKIKHHKESNNPTKNWALEWNREFSEEQIQLAKKYFKMCHHPQGMKTKTAL